MRGNGLVSPYEGSLGRLLSGFRPETKYADPACRTGIPRASDAAHFRPFNDSFDFNTKEVKRLVYEVEIEGTLPTYVDYEFVWADRGLKAARAQRERAIERIVSCIEKLEDLKKIDRKAYIGIIWIRPEMNLRQEAVGYAKRIVESALIRAGVIDPGHIHEFYDLGFAFSAHRPRTIVLITDDQDEILSRMGFIYA